MLKHCSLYRTVGKGVCAGGQGYRHHLYACNIFFVFASKVFHVSWLQWENPRRALWEGTAKAHVCPQQPFQSVGAGAIWSDPISKVYLPESKKLTCITVASLWNFPPWDPSVSSGSYHGLQAQNTPFLVLPSVFIALCLTLLGSSPTPDIPCNTSPPNSAVLSA